MCCHGNLIYKDKMNKRNNKILIDAVPIGKDLLKKSHLYKHKKVTILVLH